MTATNPIIIAHRGGIWPSIPESSIAAFEAAIATGADRLECDVFLSSDKHLVISHTDWLPYIFGDETPLQGKIGEYTLAQLQNIELGGGQRLATLEDLFALIAQAKATGKQVALEIDIKKRNTVPAIFAAVRSVVESGALDYADIVVHSISTKALRRLRSLNVDNQIQVEKSFSPFEMFGMTQVTKILADNLPYQPSFMPLVALLYNELRLSAIRIRHQFQRPELIAWVYAQQTRLIFWQGKGESDTRDPILLRTLDSLHTQGVSTGIVTDFPKLPWQ